MLALLAALAALGRAEERAEFAFVFGSRGPCLADGQLAGNGLRMGYLLGKHLRERHQQLLPARFDRKALRVVSSAETGCKQYAEAVMLGVYDLDGPAESPAARQALPARDDDDRPSALPRSYQPVPVHSFHAEDNYVFAAHDSAVCPLLAAHLKPPEHMPEVTALIAAFLPQLKRHFDYDALRKYSAPADLHFYWQHLRAQRHLGADAVPAPLLQRLGTLSSLALLAAFSDPAALRFAVSALLQSARALVEEAAAGEGRPLKLALAVGSDVSVFLLQALLGMTSQQCLLREARAGAESGGCARLPDFGSSFAFEVRRGRDGQARVVFLLNGEQRPFCARRRASCSLSEFRARVDALALPEPGRAERFCRAAPAAHGKYLLAMTACSLLLSFFMLFFLLKGAR